jgi:hypothetical protein
MSHRYWESIKNALLKFLSALLIERLPLLIIVIILSIFASYVYIYADFAIQSSPTYVDFHKNINSSVSTDLMKYAKERKYIEVKAISYPSKPFKQYSYPICLSYSIPSENGTIKDKIHGKNLLKGINVILDPNERVITVGEAATIIIESEVNNSTAGEYQIQFHGLGGGGESFISKETSMQTITSESTGKEPTHHCTITITIPEKPPKMNLSMSRGISGVKEGVKRIGKEDEPTRPLALPSTIKGGATTSQLSNQADKLKYEGNAKNFRNFNF